MGIEEPGARAPGEPVGARPALAAAGWAGAGCGQRPRVLQELFSGVSLINGALAAAEIAALLRTYPQIFHKMGYLFLV